MVGRRKWFSIGGRVEGGRASGVVSGAGGNREGCGCAYSLVMRGGAGLVELGAGRWITHKAAWNGGWRNALEGVAARTLKFKVVAVHRKLFAGGEAFVPLDAIALVLLVPFTLFVVHCAIG